MTDTSTLLLHDFTKPLLALLCFWARRKFFWNGDKCFQPYSHLNSYVKWSHALPRILNFKLEGLQAVVELSSILTLCSRALRSQILHGKTTQKVASIYPTIKPFDATSCVVLRSLVWLCKTFETEANCCLSHYCLEPFTYNELLHHKWRATNSSSTFHIYPPGLRALRSQTWLRKIDARSCVGLVR